MVMRRCWTKGLGQKIQFADPETGHVFLATYSPTPLGILISQRRGWGAFSLTSDKAMIEDK